MLGSKGEVFTFAVSISTFIKLLAHPRRAEAARPYTIRCLCCLRFRLNRLKVRGIAKAESSAEWTSSSRTSLTIPPRGKIFRFNPRTTVRTFHPPAKFLALLSERNYVIQLSRLNSSPALKYNESRYSTVKLLNLSRIN